MAASVVTKAKGTERPKTRTLEPSRAVKRRRTTAADDAGEGCTWRCVSSSRSRAQPGSPPWRPRRGRRLRAGRRTRQESGGEGQQRDQAETEEGQAGDRGRLDGQGGEPPGPGSRPRIALSDGIYAIAMTVLVLDVAVPAHLDDAAFHRALSDTLPSLGAFSLSFTLIAGFRRDHRRIRVLPGDPPCRRASVGVGFPLRDLNVQVAGRGVVWLKGGVHLFEVLLRKGNPAINGMEGRFAARPAPCTPTRACMGSFILLAFCRSPFMLCL